jgi:Glycosyl hydrolases family 43
MRLFARGHRGLSTILAILLAIESVSTVAAAATVARGNDGSSTPSVAPGVTSAEAPAADARGVLPGGDGGVAVVAHGERTAVAMAHSQPSPNNFMHAFTSSDGVNWTDLGQVFARGVRDPSLLYRNGSYWVAYTNVSGPTGAASDFGLAHAPSLTGPWTRVANVSTAAVGATSTWAPQLFVDVDGSVHVVVSLRVSGSRQLYELHPTNAEWSTWSTPVAVGGTGWAANTMDPNVTYWDGTYYMMWKDDDAGTICLSTSSSPFTDYRVLEIGNWAGWKQGFGSIEGPQVIDVGTGWRIYFTHNSGYDAVDIYYSQTSDRTMTAGWSSPTVLSSFRGYNHPLPVSWTKP